MLKTYKWRMIVTSILTLLPIAAGLILWNRLPDEMATHWNAQGVADGFLPKGAAVFIMPVFMLAVHWICFAVTMADPGNRAQSSVLMHMVFYICPVTSIGCGVLMYMHGLGREVDVIPVMQMFLGVLFIILGNYMPKCRYNHTIGIRLAWTLRDEDTWNRTHRLTGPVWVIGGFVMLCTAFLGIFWITLGVLLVGILIPTVFSYVYYHRKMVG